VRAREERRGNLAAGEEGVVGREEWRKIEEPRYIFNHPSSGEALCAEKPWGKRNGRGQGVKAASCKGAATSQPATSALHKKAWRGVKIR